VFVHLDFSAPELSDPELFATTVRNVLEGMVPLARRQVAKLPPLHASGVRYLDEPPGFESFKTPHSVWLNQAGDCAHLSLWRVAELRNAGEPAGFRVRFPKIDPNDPFGSLIPKVFHVAVRRGNGNIEDPSILLGHFPQASAV
jgi:hypothetical protein